MDKRFLGYIGLSVKRRWKEVLRTCIAAFLAVFFVTGILIFKENMFEWQIATNKDRFGNWFIMEPNTRKQSEYFVDNKYLAGYGEAQNAVKLYTQEGEETQCMAGYMTDEFIKLGCINTAEGRMPTADNEVAMDWNTLANIGITDPKVGQTVTIRYYERNEWSRDKECICEDMILVGILEDYTNVWYRGKYVPGALVTKARFDAFDNDAGSTYIYGLDKAYRKGDYAKIYEEIISETSLKPAYNMYVYDFKPWGSDTVYDYMYLLVMVIGIAALTYQLLVYKSSRTKSYELFAKLGATKVQVGLITYVENALILVTSGIIGMGFSVLTGRIICAIIEHNMGVNFYYLNVEVLIKGVLAIVIAVVIEEILSRIILLRKVFATQGSKTKKIKDKAQRNRENVAGHTVLSRKNVIRTISSRLTRANKIAQNLGVRIFSLCVGVVIIFSSYKIYDTYKKYEEIKDDIDLVGVQNVANEFSLRLPYYVAVDKENSFGNLYQINEGNEDAIEYMVKPSDDIIQGINAYQRRYDTDFKKTEVDDKVYARLYFAAFKGQFYKEPRNNITVGLSENMIKNIENVVGVEEVNYSAYESQRRWSWEGQSLINMGYERLKLERKNAIGSTFPYASRNLFATEYVKPTKEIYDRLSAYIDEDMQDYEAFEKGEQVLVLMETNPYDKYDDSLKAGDTINYHYYDLFSERYDSRDDVDLQAIFSYDKEYISLYESIYNEEDTGETDPEKIHQAQVALYERNLRYYRYVDRFEMEPCVKTKAAAVVYITDENREEFADLLPANGYYTAVASVELAKKACDAQNALTAELLEMDSLPDDAKAEVIYNQVAIKYNLLSTFSATDNIISTYFNENNVECISYYEIKEQLRTDFINAVLLFGITIIAVIVINVLICSVIARNRLEVRKTRIELLLRLGTQKNDVRRVFMIEALRESLWCILTLPLVLVVQGVIYRRNI